MYFSHSGKLEFNEQGEMKRLTYVNPKTKKITILDFNPDNGQIVNPNTINTELEFDENDDLIKFNYETNYHVCGTPLDTLDIENLERDLHGNLETIKTVYICCDKYGKNCRYQNYPCNQQ